MCPRFTFFVSGVNEENGGGTIPRFPCRTSGGKLLLRTCPRKVVQFSECGVFVDY